MNVTIYHKPNGRQEVVSITNVRPEDAAWFQAKDARISMEEIGDQFAIYADVGITDKDGEPIEQLVLSGINCCEDALSALRHECEAALMLVESFGRIQQ